jgi:hypothetical protein
MLGPKPGEMIEIVLSVTGGEHEELTEAVGQIDRIVKDKDVRRTAYRLAHGPVGERLKFVEAALRLARFAEEVLVEPESV